MTSRANTPEADEILYKYFPVLDHGFVALCDYMGNDQCIEDAARVSYGNGTRQVSDTETLIRYLRRHLHCYHPDMEVLTLDGWKKWKDCKEEEYYAVPNTENKTLTFEKLKTVSFDYSGEMHDFKNERLSYSVTPNHRMYFKGKYQKDFKNVAAEDMNVWGNFCGIQNYDFQCDYGNEKEQNEAAFAGFFIGDGYWENNTSIGFRIQKERKIRYLEKLLGVLGLTYKKTETKEGEDTVSNYRLEYPKILLKYTGLGQTAHTKELYLDKVNLTKNIIWGLLNGLTESDGSKKNNREQITFSSVSNDLIKKIQLLSILDGKDCHLLKQMDTATRVNIYMRGLPTFASRKDYHSKSNHSGKVYCTTTSTSYLVVRGGSDKFAMICGNTTPSEMVELKFHFGMPIFVARQFFRHRTFSYNEYSGRYSEVPDVYYTPDIERITKQSKNNKQGSSDEMIYDEKSYQYNFISKRMNDKSFSDYKDRLGGGWAKELARIDLPLSTYTYFYCKMNLHNLFHFLKLRCDGHAQYEIRVFADVMAGMAKRVCPLAFNAWIDYNYTSKNFSRLDIEFLKYLGSMYAPGFEMSDWQNSYETDIDSGSEKVHEKIGMGKRELVEFWGKLNPVAVPSFDLDLSTAKTAEEMR